MGKITDICVQKKNKNRVSVFIDGSFYCGLDALTALTNRLQIGQEIEEDELERVQAESEYAGALDKSLSYLSIRMRSCSEIRRYLKDKGYLSAVIDKVQNRLEEMGYLDDCRYADEYVSQNMARYGRCRLKAELIKRGVSKEIIDDVIDGTDFSEDVYALAKSLWRQCGGDKYKLKNKLYQKGCGSDDISQAVERLMEEQTEE